jgi:condensin complex subunit 2
VLDDKVISHSLTGFSFNRPFDPNGDFMPTEHTQFNPNIIHDDDESDNEPDNTNFGMDVDEGPTEDFFAGPEAINDDFAYGGGGGDDYGGDGEGGSAEPEGGEGGMGDGGARTGPFVPFDPRNAPNGRELVLGMADPDGEGGGLDYFDSRFLKNWAGPEHWKLRRTIRKSKQLLYVYPFFLSGC